MLLTAQAENEVEDQNKQLKSESKKEYFISELLSRRAKSYLGEKTANKSVEKTCEEVK